MEFRKIASNIRIEAGTDGADAEYDLEPRGNGRMCKNVQLMAKVVKAGPNAKLGLKIKHGPDGVVFVTLASVASATVPAEMLVVLDSGNGVVGEFVKSVLVAGGTATGDWTVVDVFEMRKPY